MIVIEHLQKRVEVTVYAEFTLADYEEFEVAANAAIASEGPIDLLFDLREMADFTLDVAWEDLVFSRAHANDFQRIAVITDSQWVAWSAWLSQIFVRAEMQLFADEVEAHSWLAEDEAGDEPGDEPA
ncbi:MAG: STAS/SEC14 domain-containing protein [Dokdonella sp.]|nr:MAG: STAS/SEC14 domain-containing protein [Dokdonella sp.]